LEIVDLDPADEVGLAAAFPVLQQLRLNLTAESFAQIYREGHPQGLRFTLANRQGACVGVAGWRIIATTVAGRKLHVDDLVTADAHRSTGVGRALLADLLQRAAAAGCTLLDLDSGVQRFGAHRFYLRERMALTAHHFTMQVTPHPERVAT
jgi:GNAT superfamily N-acetyltransferase